VFPLVARESHKRKPTKRKGLISFPPFHFSLASSSSASSPPWSCSLATPPRPTPTKLQVPLLFRSVFQIFMGSLGALRSGGLNVYSSPGERSVEALYRWGDAVRRIHTKSDVVVIPSVVWLIVVDYALDPEDGPLLALLQKEPRRDRLHRGAQRRFKAESAQLSRHLRAMHQKQHNPMSAAPVRNAAYHRFRFRFQSCNVRHGLNWHSHYRYLRTSKYRTRHSRRLV
jgi:hypothetical protein